MPGRITYKGSNFVVVDLTSEIHRLRGPLFPYGSRGQGPKHRERSLKDITHVNVHQTYGNIIEGEQGVLATAGFISTPPVYRCNKCKKVWGGRLASKKCTDHSPSHHYVAGGGRGFPKMSYHVWVPCYPERLLTGEYVVYYCVPFEERSWQGGGSNPKGVALALQGRLYSRHLGKKFCPWPGTTGEPSEAQKVVFHPVLHEWLFPALNLEPHQITGHFDWGKKACPGDYHEREILWLRGDLVPNDLEQSIDKFMPTSNNSVSSTLSHNIWDARQKALEKLGFVLFGGITKVPDDFTKSAILALQEYKGIDATGYWDEETENAVTDMLQQLGIFDSDNLS